MKISPDKKRKITTPGPQTTEDMVAMSVRGYTMGAIRDGWMVFFHNRQSRPHDGLIDELCVVKTDTDRVMLRFLKRGRKPDTWDLLPVSGTPTLDAVLVWAEKVEWIRPHKITDTELVFLENLKTFGEVVE